MSTWPHSSITFWTSSSGTPGLVRSPANTSVSPSISRRGLLGDVAVEVVDQDLRALLGEQLGRRAPDPARRAGDDRHLAVEDCHLGAAFRSLSARCAACLSMTRQIESAAPMNAQEWIAAFAERLGSAPPTPRSSRRCSTSPARRRTPPSGSRRRSPAGSRPRPASSPEQALRGRRGSCRERWLSAQYDIVLVRRHRLHRRADRRVPGAHTPAGEHALGARGTQPRRSSRRCAAARARSTRPARSCRC